MSKTNEKSFLVATYIKKHIKAVAQTLAAFLGRAFRIELLPEYSSDLGYTMSGNTAYVASYHPLYESLTTEKAFELSVGVAVHEWGHQKLTNFEERERRIELRPVEERGLYSMFFNIVEDPRIENFIPNFVGGFLSDCLNFMRGHLYVNSPKIEDRDDAFSQLVSAMIQFGDEGLLLGHFTYSEAQEIFAKVSPVFNEAIDCPDGIKMFDYVDKIFELTRPLWQDQADAAKRLSELLKKFGKSEATGNSSGTSGGKSSETEKSKRRKITIKEVSKEEYEEAKKNSESSSKLPDGDITLLVCKEETNDENQSEEPTAGASSGSATESDKNKDTSAEDSKTSSETEEVKDKVGSGKGSSGKSDSEKECDKGMDGTDNNSSESGNNGSSNEASDNKSCDDASKSRNASHDRSDTSEKAVENESDSNNAGSGDNSSENLFSDEEIINTISEECEISDDDLQSFLDFVEELLKPIASEYAENFDAKELTSLERTPKILNEVVKADDWLAASYDKHLQELKIPIGICAKQMRNIFDRDVDDKSYRASGKPSLKRICSGKITPNLFEKRKEPDGKRDIAVQILVDMSGSMSGEKIEAAKKCCIALAEIFGKLDIPLHVIGFSADMDGYDAIHYHFVQWKNRKEDRKRLCKIQALADNTDGVSIRYGTKNLMKRPETKKLLIVISDGLPAAYFYRNSEGFEDTRSAIAEAKKLCNVFGVGINISSYENKSFKAFYGNDYVSIKTVNELFPVIAKKIKAVMNK